MGDKVVYGWFDKDECFYIGLGSLARSRSIQYRNVECLRKRQISQNSGQFFVRIFQSDLTTESARILEKKLIQKYGRVNKGTGTLLNKTCGGEKGRNKKEQTLRLGDWLETMISTTTGYFFENNDELF